MRKTPVTLGTVSIVLGSLGSLMSIASLATRSKMTEMAMAQHRNQPELAALQRRIMEAGSPYQDILGYFWLALALTLIVVGVGLRRRADWARVAGMAWGVAGLVYAGSSVLFQLLIMMPLMRDLMDTVMKQAGRMPEQARAIITTATGVGTGFGVYFGALASAALPIVMLALLGRPGARDDFQPPRAG